MNTKFKTDYNSILTKIESIDPISYGKTRNYINGSVTYLSPYISRGVISAKQILKSIFDKGYKLKEIEPFVKELAWRDYFQRVAQHKNLNTFIKNEQTQVSNMGIPNAILTAKTGIEAIDNAIKLLYETGYMHNHSRMYLASLACNIAKSNWLTPAKWMYYHLLDGDWASNSCSWQWVAGANSNKKYFANQENINKFTFSNQINTFLDKSYSELENSYIPEILMDIRDFNLITELPNSDNLKINTQLPTLIYNFYNLDPVWHQNEDVNRILFIEPELFEKYPVRSKSINFMLDLSKNIPNIKIYVGSFVDLVKNHKIKDIYFKEHFFNNYIGTEESRDWIVEEIADYYPSFFSYWKKIYKFIEN